MKDHSVQEQFIREISLHLLGNQAVFKPLNYGKNALEPCDLVWISGRCAVIIYMTSGKKEFTKKSRHNYSQMHKWIRHWRQGENLYDGKNISIGYEDVDYIIGISVVGGEYGVSKFNYDQIEYAHRKSLDTKFCAAITLSDQAILRLSKRSVGIRDLINLINYLSMNRTDHSDSDIVDWLEKWESDHAANARSRFKIILPSGNELNDAWHQTKIFIRSIREKTEMGEDAFSILEDLSMPDIIWLSVAERSLSRQIAPPGAYGTILIGARRNIGNYNINSIVAASMSKMKDFDFTILNTSGMTVLSTLEYGPESPIRVIMVYGKDNERMIYNDLELLKSQNIFDNIT